MSEAKAGNAASCCDEIYQHNTSIHIYVHPHAWYGTMCSKQVHSLL